MRTRRTTRRMRRTTRRTTRKTTRKTRRTTGRTRKKTGKTRKTTGRTGSTGSTGRKHQKKSQNLLRTSLERSCGNAMSMVMAYAPLMSKLKPSLAWKSIGMTRKMLCGVTSSLRSSTWPIKLTITIRPKSMVSSLLRTSSWKSSGSLTIPISRR